MAKHRYPRVNAAPLRGYSISRTVEAPQPKVEKFLNSAGRVIGRLAFVKTVTSTHITLFESISVRQAFKERSDYEPEQLKNFFKNLDQQLEDHRDKKMVVQIDRDHPLSLYGNSYDKLVLNVVNAPELIKERELIEEILVDEFGRIPPSKPFGPHITFGRVYPDRLSRKERDNPALLLPKKLIPAEIAINGLSVYLNGRPIDAES